MNTTDDSLRAEIILLATKALDLLNHALDLLSADVVGRSALPLGSSKNASERCSIVGNASECCSIVGNASERCSAGSEVGRSALPLGSSKNVSERCSSGSVVGNASERCNAGTDQSTGCHAWKRDPLPCSTATNQSANCHAWKRDPLHDNYRANTIRFNEQYLRDHYDLRYNTMLKTTEFRPKAAVQLGARASRPPWKRHKQRIRIYLHCQRVNAGVAAIPSP